LLKNSEEEWERLKKRIREKERKVLERARNQILD